MIDRIYQLWNDLKSLAFLPLLGILAAVDWFDQRRHT